MVKKWIALSASMLLLVAANACGKKPGGGEAPAKKEEAAQEAAPSASAAGVGGIKGVVKFTGTAPEMPELNRQSDPFCAKTPMKAQYVMVNDNATLKNVAVTLEGVKGAKSEQLVEVDQKNCMYDPRVTVGTVDKEIEVHNSDETLHNVHTYMGSKTLFNKAQPKGSKPIKKAFKESGIIKFKCDVHPWMTGWMVVTDSGLGTVSNETGEFEIKDVPAGTYKLKFFQEHYGEKTVDVTVKANEVATAEVTYDGTEKASFKYREVILSHAGHAGHVH